MKLYYSVYINVKNFVQIIWVQPNDYIWSREVEQKCLKKDLKDAYLTRIKWTICPW